jgi:urease accessory protein
VTTLVHQHGLLSLRLAPRAGSRTCVVERLQRFPLRMTVPLYVEATDPGMAFVYVQNPTGGVFAGDRLDTRVATEPGARVHVTTQSATKLYRMDGGSAAAALAFQIAPGAYVEHMPDPLIPQAGADYRQSTDVAVAGDGVFVGSEIVGPGRHACGERFAYKSIRLSTRVVRGETHVCSDALELRGGPHSPSRSGVLGSHDYLASLVVVCPEHDVTELCRRLDHELAAADAVLAAAGVLPRDCGVLARILARSGDAAARALASASAVVRRELAGLPPLRVRK